jgi:hypothetical protein
LVIEEFGLPRDGHSFSPLSQTRFSDAYYRAIFSVWQKRNKENGVIAGCNFWAFSGKARPIPGQPFWKKGDDYMGDPPMEEQGLYGSAKYAAAHAAELPKYQAVLVLDNGTGKITGMAMQGRDELQDTWRALFQPISALGPFTVRPGNKGGTDHLSFLRYGVPGFNYDQLSRGDDHTHHSQVDTFDHAIVGDVAQAATVMAATAFQLANLPALLPRNPAPPTSSR